MGGGGGPWRWLRRILALRNVIITIIICFIFTILLLTMSLPSTPKRSGGNGNGNTQGKRKAQSDIRFPSGVKITGQKNDFHLIKGTGENERLAVIVPFRDRFEELQTFAPFIYQFLNGQGVDHHIFVVNQVDSLRFNRAALINVGYLLATKKDPDVKYMAMHDVDLLPLNDKLPYAIPSPSTVVHVAWLHPKYNYPSFIGGILLLSVEDFQRVDGMSNIYWGWGLEDDEFWVRLKQGGISVQRADESLLGSTRKTTFRHIHSPKTRPRDRVKCFDQAEKTKKRDKLTGLHNVNYTLLSSTEMTIEGAPLTIFNVQLHCDRKISPWCSCDDKTATPTHTQNNNNNS